MLFKNVFIQQYSWLGIKFHVRKNFCWEFCNIFKLTVFLLKSSVLLEFRILSIGGTILLLVIPGDFQDLFFLYIWCCTLVWLVFLLISPHFSVDIFSLDTRPSVWGYVLFLIFFIILIYNFCCTAKWPSYTYIYTFFFSHHPPLCSVTSDWI